MEEIILDKFTPTQHPISSSNLVRHLRTPEQPSTSLLSPEEDFDHDMDEIFPPRHSPPALETVIGRQTSSPPPEGSPTVVAIPRNDPVSDGASLGSVPQPTATLFLPAADHHLSDSDEVLTVAGLSNTFESPPSPVAGNWDAAEEMDPHAEEGEFARFMSQIKGKDLDDVRREIDDEIKTLNQQRKAAMRDSEDITQQMISQIMVH
jgi:DNA excision repair protein ERCC-5